MMMNATSTCLKKTLSLEATPLGKQNDDQLDGSFLNCLLALYTALRSFLFGS